jgi:hypothetical protein
MGELRVRGYLIGGREQSSSHLVWPVSSLPPLSLSQSCPLLLPFPALPAMAGVSVSCSAPSVSGGLLDDLFILWL